jgi:hypothetical protein
MNPAVAIGATVLGAVAAISLSTSPGGGSPTPASTPKPIDLCATSQPAAYCTALAWQRAGSPETTPPHSASKGDPLRGALYKIAPPIIVAKTTKTPKTKTRTKTVYKTRTITQYRTTPTPVQTTTFSVLGKTKTQIP